MPAPRPAHPPAPGVIDALFGKLPEGWRERHGTPPASEAVTSPDRRDPAQSDSTSDSTDSKASAPDTPGRPPRRPGDPASPWHMRRSSWFKVLRRTAVESANDRVTSVAGGVSYFGLLSLFPAITALVSIYGWVADENTIVDSIVLLNRILPESAVELIAGQIAAIVQAPGSALTLAGIISILFALWTANGGMKAMISALNVAWFETEKRGIIALNLLSLALTIGAIILIILMIATVTVLPAVVGFVTHEGSLTGTLVNVVRWPILFGVLLMALAVLYRFGPSKNDPNWQWISPGALLAAVGLILGSLLFSWYAANFGNYNETYGSLSAAIVLMVWLWLSAVVVLVGAELNSEVERQIKIENGVQPQDEKNLQKQIDSHEAAKR